MTSPILDTYTPGQERKRVPFPCVNPFRSFVTAEMLRRKVEYPTPVISPFVRMTSCLEASGFDDKKVPFNYRYVHLGLHGFDSAVSTNIFDLTYGGNTEYVGTAYKRQENGVYVQAPISVSEIDTSNFFGAQLNVAQGGPSIQGNIASTQVVGSAQLDIVRDAPYAQGTLPMPGVEVVLIDRFAEGAGVVAKVTWRCYGLQQLEYLRHFFMTVGTNIVIEYGHSFSNQATPSYPRLDFSSDDIDTTLALSLVKGRRWIIENYVSKSDGNYDFLVGTIGNFTMTFDSATNGYTITTTVYGSGESLFGIPTYNTVGLASNQISQDNLIEEFFKPGGDFDKLLMSELALPTNRDVFKMPGTDDYIFVSWNMFIDGVLYHLLNKVDTVIQAATILNEETQTIDSIQRDILSFYRPTITDDTKEITENPVGYNTHLLSVDPEVMLLINRPALENPERGSNYGLIVFDEYYPPLRNPNLGADAADKVIKNKLGDQSFTGKLSSGVLLTNELIREAFLQNKSFPQAIRYILTRMNTAACNYWALQLIFNPDTERYEVIDRKFAYRDLINITPSLPMYKFNYGTTGECINISFDAAFPPEAVTQMMIMARFKSDPNAFAVALEKYPLIGVESLYALALNWSNTKDTLVDAVKNLRNGPARPTSPFAFTPSTAWRNLPPNLGPIAGTPVAIGTVKNQKSIVPLVSSEELSADAEAPSPSPKNVQAVDARIAPYADIIRENGRRIEAAVGNPNLDGAALIRSIIQAESSGRADVTGVSGNDYGLMQINGIHNPYGAGNKDRFIAEMKDPKKNVAKGTDLIIENIRTLTRIFGGTVYMENLIISHKTGAGYGAKYELSGRYIDPDSFSYYKRIASSYVTRVSGTQTSQQIENTFRQPIRGTGPLPTLKASPRLTDKIMNRSPYSKYYDASSGVALLRGASAGEEVSTTSTPVASTPPVVPIPPSGGAFIPVADLLAVAGASAARQTESAATEKKMKDKEQQDAVEAETLYGKYKDKFGDRTLAFIEFNRSTMITRILKDGIQNQASNNFIAPIPVNVKITLAFKGIGGLSLFDGFKVDKLPYIYEKYGVFQITKLRESIAAGDGWVTELDGIYRFMRLDGSANTIPTVF